MHNYKSRHSAIGDIIEARKYVYRALHGFHNEEYLMVKECQRLLDNLYARVSGG